MADKELDRYIADKQEEARRQQQPARSLKDRDWNGRRHLDPERASRRTNPGDTPPDAEGQEQEGHIEQTITDDRFTQPR